MKVSKETQMYLRNVIVCYEQKPHGSEVIFSKTPDRRLWTLISCPHDSHAGEAREHLTAKKWKNGHSGRDVPRKPYGRDNVVLHQ